MVESLGRQSRSWLQDALSGLTLRAEYAEEYAVYRRVASTIRTLAEVGRAVIVGRGGVFITRGMPGGIHLRLVAPLPFRIAAMARTLNTDERDAATIVRDMEHARDTFYRRYWPGESLCPETFTAVLNTQDIDERQLSDWVAALLTGTPTRSAALP